MSSKTITLCKWKSKHIHKDFVRLRKMVRKPKYVCRKCARVAGRKEWLCKPKSLL